MSRKNTPADFWRRVDVRELEPGACWLWQGGASGGYGVLRFQGERKTAHRLSYELANGEIPCGQLVRHKCDTPLCVNPAHLELGTIADNMRDREERGRTARGEAYPDAKLTEQAVRVIRRSHERARDLATRFGVTEQAIHCVLRGKTWGHVS